MELEQLTKSITNEIENLPFDEKVKAINAVRKALHEISPFANEPVDFVEWVKNDCVVANDYNPNKVAPPEMELLEVSIMNDGYTQPIVTWPKEDQIEVVDGFHRTRVGKESKVVGQRVSGYLPAVTIRSEQQGKNDRIASTIRHNRARGKHQIDAMSEIVLELKNRNWANKRIARELGMDEDEILRLCQISGLEEMFSDVDFSKAWESNDQEEYETFSEELSEELIEQTRATNTNDPDRIFHTFDKWEITKTNFFASTVDGKSKDDLESEYANFLRDKKSFEEACKGLTTDWQHSCEHYLTNKSMNRVAWMGQAAACYAKELPSVFCSGFNLLSDEEQKAANLIALEWINYWLTNNNREAITMEEAYPVERQVEIY